jgi:hypothetical protein
MVNTLLSSSRGPRPLTRVSVSYGGDIRSFYAAIGIELPQWSGLNATTRCFANPDMHAHEDRTPSCSVSLEHGAWRCWGCGASGGAYDAAVARGHTPSSAIELMVNHGLVERRDAAAARVASVAGAAGARSAANFPAPRALQVTEADVERWHEALFSRQRATWLKDVCDRRLWDPATLRQLQLGYDRGRITIPIRDGNRGLRGALRYLPGAVGRKMLAEPGTKLGLIPHPVYEPARRILLVEGPPDMIAARSRGWAAIAVPGDHAWRREWAHLFRGREVLVLMDSDAAGRTAAARITADLSHVAASRQVDLAPDRNDGFDLTDWLRLRPRPRRVTCKTSCSSKPTMMR